MQKDSLMTDEPNAKSSGEKTISNLSRFDPHYSNERKNLKYYSECLSLIEEIKLSCDINSIIDIGGRRGSFLLKTGIPEKTALDIRPRKPSSKDVKLITEDFLDWVPDKEYDIALCMQTLEHIEEDRLIDFTRRLFTFANHLIITVPYRWDKNFCKYHIHDPINKEKLHNWTGKAADKYTVVNDRGLRRLIAYYKI